MGTKPLVQNKVCKPITHLFSITNVATFRNVFIIKHCVEIGLGGHNFLCMGLADKQIARPEFVAQGITYSEPDPVF